MAYTALYRKWRPSGFDELVGQEHVSRTLSNAINSGKVAHAYLFAGPRGTGKTSTAKILAKGLNCEKGPTPNPCNQCAACQRINSGASMDVLEIDAASNRGIDEIRNLRETVKFAPTEGKYKVYIIDEVHMLTMEAFNALLKTLEEPPASVVFILATTEAHKVPATIQSRCQRYDFKRIVTEDIKNRLQLVADNIGLEYEDAALGLIALKAEGGMRDALGLLDQCAALSQGKLTVEKAQGFLGLVGRQWIEGLAEAIGKQEAAQALAKVADILQGGKELSQMLSELAMYFRSMLVLKAAGSVADIDYGADSKEALAKQAAAFTQEELIVSIRRIHAAIAELKWSPQPRIAVEAALLELCQGAAVSQPSAVQVGENAKVADGIEAKRIASLEDKLRRLEALVQRGGGAAAGFSVQNVSSPKASPSVRVQGKNLADKAESPPVPAVHTADNAAVYRKLLEKMDGPRNGPAVSCVKRGVVLSVTEEEVILGASNLNKGLIDRLYKKKIEKALHAIFGRPMRVKCQIADILPMEQAESAVSTPEPDLPDIPPPTDEDMGVDMDSLPSVERDSLKKAAEIFGGSVMEIEDEGK